MFSFFLFIEESKNQNQKNSFETMAVTTSSVSSRPESVRGRSAPSGTTRLLPLDDDACASPPPVLPSVALLSVTSSLGSWLDDDLGTPASASWDQTEKQRDKNTSLQVATFSSHARTIIIDHS